MASHFRDLLEKRIQDEIDKEGFKGSGRGTKRALSVVAAPATAPSSPAPKKEQPKSVSIIESMRHRKVREVEQKIEGALDAKFKKGKSN